MKVPTLPDSHLLGRPQPIWRIGELPTDSQPGRRWIELELWSSSNEGPPLVRGATESHPGTPLASVLERLAPQGTGLCLRLLRGGPLLPRLRHALDGAGWNAKRLRFHARLRAEELEVLRSWFPEAGLQCPVDFLVPMLLDNVPGVRDAFDRLRARGVDRFAVDWFTPCLDEVLRKLEAWGCDVHLDHVPQQDRARAEQLGVHSIGLAPTLARPPRRVG